MNGTSGGRSCLPGAGAGKEPHIPQESGASSMRIHNLRRRDTMIGREKIETLGRASGNVVGQDGEKIGGIGELYVDDDTNQPTWVTVKTGLFGMKESFVPLGDA